MRASGRAWSSTAWAVPDEVPVDPSWDQYDEHPVASRDRPLDDLTVVRRSRNDGDAPLESVELSHALLPAHADPRLHVDSGVGLRCALPT
jgi:hypothetical protein